MDDPYPTTTPAGMPRARTVPATPETLYVVFDAAHPLARSSRHVLHDIDVVEIGRGAVRAARRDRDGAHERLVLQLADGEVSRAHARLHRRERSWVIEDLDSRNGVDVNGVRQREATLVNGDLVRIGRTFLLFRVAAVVRPDRPDLDASELAPIAGLTTWNAILTAQLERARAAASAPHLDGPPPILVRGPTGSGKELVARAVHELSGRRGEFAACNCAAVPTKLPSELFGHIKGAFTDAKEDRVGLVEHAHRGTLFLDEVGDLPLELQAALLRVLQEREVLPIGATRARPVDILLVSATHHDLERLVRDGAFREDFYARIAGLAVVLPPVAAHREDLGLILSALLRRIDARAEQRQIENDAAAALLADPWPQNVRQIEHRLRAALAMAGDHMITLEHVTEPSADYDIGDRRHGPVDRRRTVGPGKPSRAESQRAEVEAALRKHAGNITKAAEALGRSRSSLQRTLKRLGIDPEAADPEAPPRRLRK